MNVSLSGTWMCRPDPDDMGIREKWFAAEPPELPSWSPVSVPCCWNSDPRFERYEGAFWYAVDFSLPADLKPWQTDLALRFGAVNYFCRIWVNGAEAGAHEGGFLPFEIPLARNALQPVNRLVAMVENRRSDQRIPGRVFDWYNYGGIVRDVDLLCRSPRRFDAVRVCAEPRPGGAAAVRIAYVQHEPFAFSWAVSDHGRILAQAAVPGDQVRGEITFELKGISCWSPDSPQLYGLSLDPEPLSHSEPYSTRFGVRSIAVRGHEILLNGAPVKLQGVSLHEEQVPYGRAIPRAMRYDDVRAIKDLGFNALRTAHYTHDEALLHAADEIGLLVLEEIPVYWEIDYQSDAVFALAQSMVRDMVARDFNHPSVILWSVGNEVPVERPACHAFMTRLMDYARSLDSSRMVTYVSSRFLMDDTRRAADVACMNCYLGWYMGRMRDMPEVLQLARRTAPDKPWIMTEFGAGALAGNITRHLTRTVEKGPEAWQSMVRQGVETLVLSGALDLGPARFSEEYQDKFLKYYIRTLNAMDWVSGWFIWVYRDFRSPLRVNPFQKGFNRKGLVSETNIKKSICFRLPELLQEKQPPAPVRNPASKFILFKALERTAYKVVLPNLFRMQRKMFDDYYTRKPD